MWLDRLAGAPTNVSGSSTPASRSYSPLPRRTSNTLSPYVTSQRTAHSARSSSLSLVSNESSVSLLSSSRRPSGSGLRQSSSAVADGSNLMDSLEKLLSADKDDSQPATLIEQDLDFTPDFGDLSLKEFVEEADQGTPRRLLAAEECEADKSKFDGLHSSIVACDDILNSVEANLASFRNDLAAVSADIETLQSRSGALNRRLENRNKVERVLGPLVEELSVPPDIVTTISEGPIDDQWLKALSEVDRRAVAQGKKMAPRSGHPKAFEELGPLLEKLKLRAIERIRDYLVAQIKALRSPHIDAQMIQQQNFLKFKDLCSFLHRHHATLAQEITLAYMNTMRWYYVNQFSRYEKALAKIKLHALDKNDALGHEDATRMAAILSTSRVAGPHHDAFNLGRRITLLKAKNQPALSSYMAEEDQSMHYLEVPFRNFNLALVDNATAEYTFLASFFHPALSLSQVSRNFNYIFEPTFELGRTLSKTLVGETYDAIGVLMCIRLNQQFAFELQRRKVPALDSYVNATNMLLWPRLQVVMDRHCESVRQLTNSLPARPSRSGGDQSRATAAPHVVTQRFGQILHGFLALSAEAGDDEPVVASLQRLRSDVEAFLTRQSQLYGHEKRKSSRFLYNNFSLILTIMGDTDGRLAAEQRNHFELLKAAHVDESS
ncbi:Vps52 / Sac2 family protein [Ophiocordyceps camponoti-floridani]|uniref:Vps52 / Sac2 family protein n=1 Tax=Ophiocordyceps camponoti-floridani TaxID=2030778 RepID=A0A8H4Q6G2_9HYPO|nr:Vps52 / Sac2 family protein [Ophiocordyceps camponoti-floridani]